MSENVERINQIYYTLYSDPLGLIEIQDPNGYESDYKSYEIDPDTKAIRDKIVVDLEFFGNAHVYLKNIYEVCDKLMRHNINVSTVMLDKGDPSDLGYKTMLFAIEKRTVMKFLIPSIN